MNAFQVASIDGDTAISDDVTMSKLKAGCCDFYNTYSVGFPLELDDIMKASFIGAVILIDLIMHQQSGG